MSNKCETVIISDKAYNAMIRESFAKHPVETGGILLGYILDNGLWVVMEMIPPGINGVFETAYFEYDQDFVNYLGTSVANQYKESLQVLGLWHRHPGSMDYFSSTDDVTNSEFASRNPHGVITGLVNIDPSFRLTMYHLDHNNGVRPRHIAYSTVEVEVGDDLIPEKFFSLRYIDEERSELHPTPTHTNTHVSQTRSVPKSPRNGGDNEVFEQSMPEVTEQPKREAKEKDNSTQTISSVNNHQKRNSRKWLLPVIAVAIFLIGALVGVTVAPHFNSPKTMNTQTVTVENGDAKDKDNSTETTNSEEVSTEQRETQGNDNTKNSGKVESENKDSLNLTQK